MSAVFEPLTLRGLTLPNRLWVSPMCQYSATDGLPDDWHLVHLGARAVGGAGLVVTEATAVNAEGRITPGDTGLYDDEQERRWTRIVGFLHEQGAAVGIQIAHAGRKASTAAPWEGGGDVRPEDGGWTTLAPSPVAFPGLREPRAMTTADLTRTVEDFAATAERAHRAGFDVAEVHAAHGYLLHEFLSPLANHRTDAYGGDRDARMRYPLEVVEAVRSVWPAEKPLFVRVSASDWVEGGWTVDDTVAFARALAPLGVDLVDCSSGGAVPGARIELRPGYQVPFAQRVRAEAGLPTAAVGLLTDPHQVEQVVADGSADAVFLARELLRDPNFPLRAAHALGVDVAWPVQYQRARWAA